MLLGLRHRDTSFESGLQWQCVWMYIHKVAHLSVKVHFQMVNLSRQWDLMTLLSGSQEFLRWTSICVLECNSWIAGSRWGIPLVTKVMRKEARHTQRLHHLLARRPVNILRPFLQKTYFSLKVVGQEPPSKKALDKVGRIQEACGWCTGVC